MLSRRFFLSGLVSTLAAPAIVHAEPLLEAVRPVFMQQTWPLFTGEIGVYEGVRFIGAQLRPREWWQDEFGEDASPFTLR